MTGRLIIAKSMNGEEVARELISTLYTSYGIESKYILAAMGDGASVNGAAMRIVRVVYPQVMDVRCFSHTLDIVGEKFNAPILTSFISYWVSLFSHSPKTKRLKLERPWLPLAKTRWWSKWESCNKLWCSLVIFSLF